MGKLTGEGSVGEAVEACDIPYCLREHAYYFGVLSQMRPHLHRLNALYGSNVCGEGGEYESLVLDCPVFRNGRIVIDDTEVT